MQIKISKTLEGIIARTAFIALRDNKNEALKDQLFLEILNEQGSLTNQLLNALMEPWQLYQAQLRIRNHISAVNSAPSQLAEDDLQKFFEEFRDHLKSQHTSGSISTLNAMTSIVNDSETTSSAILAMYGITPELLKEKLAELTPQPISSLDTKLSTNTATPHQLLIDKYSSDLTQQAAQGKIDRVIGRDEQIDRMIEILSRRKKNNPIIIGEAGVGKSAIVEGLALRIADGNIPHSLRRKRLLSLDISSLIAGTKFRGEFEERMQQLVDELQQQSNIIVFIDEIHTIVGAGATQGSLDVANILKPSLSKGLIQTIGATTLKEYRENIETDQALLRRFQQVMVEPTTPEQTLEIVQKIAPYYEKYHNVRFTPEALQRSVELTDRYITNRHQPDKAIDLLDEAGARANIANGQTPSEIIELEQQLKIATDKRIEAIREMEFQQAASSRLDELAITAKISESERAWKKNATQSAVTIDTNEIEQLITATTGIPIERLSNDEQSRVRNLATHLSERIIGQSEAVDQITRTITLSRSGLREQDRPIGVMMLIGPTGVGKTLLAKELSKWMFDHKRSILRYDMSEYSEKHNIARLIGSPPGYVGYGEGGQLTEAVRRHPYSVVLFDEIEKAHPDVYNIMLQIFDEGQLTDGSGRKVDFRNTIIILTSNIGSRQASQSVSQVGYSNLSKLHNQTISPQSEYHKALEQRFSPEFINRLDSVVIFRSLDKKDIGKIIDLEITKIANRAKKVGFKLRLTRGAREILTSLGYNAKWGARSLRRTLTNHIEEPLSKMIVDGAIPPNATITVLADRGNKDGVKLKVA